MAESDSLKTTKKNIENVMQKKKKTNGSKKSSNEKSSGKQAPDTETESELFRNRTARNPKGEAVTLTKTDIKRLEKTYYKEGYTLGRDALYGVLKDKYPDDKPPTKRGILAWLKQQELHQLYLATRNSDSAVSFSPYKPLDSLSADLIDFTNKPAQQYRYILVVIDNYSRYMFAEAITGKKARKTAKAMEKILDRIKKEYDETPSYILSDDGSEFKAEYVKMLESRDIEKRRTIGGAPQSNGMAERANGKLKMLLSMNKEIFRGSWKSNLEKCVDIYNDYVNRTTGFKPSVAIKFTDKEAADAKRLRENVKKVQRAEKRSSIPNFEVGDKVRVKISKGKLDKMSTPNWSAKIWEIKKVLQAESTVNTKYQVSGMDADKRYARSDLQRIWGGKSDPIPVRPMTKKEQAVEDEVVADYTRGAKKRKKAQEKKEEGDEPRRRSSRNREAEEDEDMPSQDFEDLQVGMLIPGKTGDAVGKRKLRRSTRVSPLTAAGVKSLRGKEIDKIVGSEMMKDKRTGREMIHIKIRWKGLGPEHDSWDTVNSMKHHGAWQKYSDIRYREIREEYAKRRKADLKKKNQSQ